MNFLESISITVAIIFAAFGGVFILDAHLRFKQLRKHGAASSSMGSPAEPTPPEPIPAIEREPAKDADMEGIPPLKRPRQAALSRPAEKFTLQ